MRCVQANNGRRCASNSMTILISGLMTYRPNCLSPRPHSTQITETVWALRQDLTGRLTEAIVDHAHRFEFIRQEMVCEDLPVHGHDATVGVSYRRHHGGQVRLERPYFYCRVCKVGLYPLDEALGLTPGRTQLDVQKAAARLVVETAYDEAQTLFHDLTGVHLGSERMHTLTNRVAEGLSVLGYCPVTLSRLTSASLKSCLGSTLAAGKWRRPVVVFGIDGAYAPTRPESARGRRPGQRRQRARGPLWKGQWREVKGFRFYLIDGERIVHLLSWHQIQHEAELGEALKASQRGESDSRRSGATLCDLRWRLMDMGARRVAL